MNLHDLLATEVKEIEYSVRSITIKESTPLIYCMDGFTMSVQTGETLYCEPRDNYGPWTRVEIGFPSERVEEFMPFIDGDETTDPTETVYGYVPIDIVEKVIEQHGGINFEWTFLKAKHEPK